MIRNIILNSLSSTAGEFW